MHKYTHLMIYTEIFHCSLLLVDRFSSVGAFGFLQYVFHTQTPNIVKCMCMSLSMYAYDERKKNNNIYSPFEPTIPSHMRASKLLIFIQSN